MTKGKIMQNLKPINEGKRERERIRVTRDTLPIEMFS